jgi:hypothetical protein
MVPTVAFGVDDAPKAVRPVKWKVSRGKNPKVLGCVEGGKKAPLERCENELGGMKRLFTDFTETRCALFTADFVFVRDLPRGDCAIANLCADPNTGVLTRYTKDALGQITRSLIGESLTEKTHAIEQAPRRSRVTFRDLILEGKNDVVLTRALGGEACFNFVQKIYRSGMTLASECLFFPLYEHESHVGSISSRNPRSFQRSCVGDGGRCLRKDDALPSQARRCMEQFSLCCQRSQIECFVWKHESPISIVPGNSDALWASQPS